MNLPILIAGIFTLVAFAAHVTVGYRESLQLDPRRLSHKTSEPAKESVVVYWAQAMCAFQMISVDLLLVSGLLFVLAATDWAPAPRTIAAGLALLFVLWGVAWLLQILALRRKRQDYLQLGQWLLWFANAGLVYWGSRSL